MNNILTLLHLFSVIVFLGNIVTEIRWLYQASKTGNKEIIRFAITEIIKGDKVFTLPCVFLITVSGNFVYSNFPMAENHWLLFALVSYLFSGIVYTVRVAPLQKKIFQMVSDTSAMLPNSYKKLYASWNFWGWIALLTAVLALTFTIIRIPL
jgi:uncharacterized membrane protein